MPAPRYVDAVRGQTQSQPRESASPRRGHATRGSGTSSQSAGQKPAPLPHDPRFVFTFAAAMERRVTVKSGAEFEGTLHGPGLGTKNIHLTLRDARRLDKSSDNAEIIETLVIPAQEFVQMTARNVPFSYQHKTQNGVQTQTKNEEESKTESEYTEEKVEYEVLPVKDENDMSGFMGDIERAAGKKQSVERTLVAWSGGDAVGEDLELKGDTRDWCQFADKANSGVQSTFNMEDYTSKLNVKESRYTEEDAARIAREIEAEKLDLPQKLLDDSGVFDEEVLPPAKEDQTRQSTKPFSWVDAVKGKTTPQPISGHPTSKGSTPEPTRKTPEALETTQPPPTFQKVTPRYEGTSDCIPHRISGAAAFNSGQPCVEPRGGPQISFGFDSSEALFLTQQESSQPLPFVPGEEQEPVFGTVRYALGNRMDAPPVESHSTGFGITTENVAERAVPYYGDPVWGMQPNQPAPVKTEVVALEPEPLNQAFSESTPPENPDVSPAVRKTEARKPTSKVSAGISFKDKLTANLPNKAPKAVTPVKHKAPPQSGHAHTRSQSSFVDPAMDPIVQSPRGRTDAGRTFSGKLISNPRRNELHPADSARALPSEEHLLSPMTGTPPIIYPQPVHEIPPASMHVMAPPVPHGGYPEMSREGMKQRGPYGSYGGTVDHPPVVHPPVMAVMPPPTHYPSQPHPQFSPAPDGRVGDEEMEAGRSRRHFQLNPMAKAFKPVVSIESASNGHEQYPPPQYAAPPAEYGSRTPHGDVRPPFQQPPTGPPPQQHTPKHPHGPGEAVMPEYSANPPLPGVRPPFLPPSNVVTPWPSFPGTGVWHSTLGAPRPGTPQANAMMNGFMPPGMPPGAYPMFVPGMPPPYMGGMQDPMWRPPPMPHGIPDQQSMALLWRNYYDHVVPPDKRTWNPSKFTGHAGAMSRQPRNHRRTSNMGNNQHSGSFQAQSPATQQSAEMP